VIDLPPGKWSDLLVGAWWPTSGSTDSAVASSTNRATTRDNYDSFEHRLYQTRTGPLADQEGATAQGTKDAFAAGEHQARAIADISDAKSSAFRSAADAIEGLRSELSGTAARGNHRIDQIQSDNQIKDKITPILDVIRKSNEEAGAKSDSFSSPIKQAIEKVLAADGDLRSAEDFGKQNGVDLQKPAPLDAETLRHTITQMLDAKPVSAADSAAESRASARFGGNEGVSAAESATGIRGDNVPAPSTESARADLGGSDPVGRMPNSSISSNESVSSSLKGAVIGEGYFATTDAQSVGPTGSTPATGPAASATSSGSSGTLSGAGSLTAASGGSPTLPSSSGLSSGAPSLSPESLAESFTSGMQAGAPVSAGAEALSQGISDTVQSQAQQNTPPPMNSVPTAPTAGFAFDAPQQYSEPAAAPAQAPPADTQHQQMYAAPVAAGPTAAAPMATPPAAPPGPLPTYGSDLRPATAAAPPPPATAAPLSAPVNPASGTAASSQPAVVRQQATVTTATSPTGLVENAITSATTGATAGAASEQSAASARLQRLLEAVARQEPKLTWAIADRQDGSTILVTDLASGWIPPHVEIPTGIQILDPAKRRGTAEHLLGETINLAVWTPGHYLPPAKDADPVPMSFRARQVPDINDLNWEITQATNWRDGLPRLAHTLTKAGIAGTGVLETESDLLYAHLTAVRDKVVKSYPDNVDATDMGNWQLLAAIGALIAKDTTALKYHFAWFQALSMATQGGTR
jgi:hypothetical protein